MTPIQLKTLIVLARIMTVMFEASTLSDLSNNLACVISYFHWKISWIIWKVFVRKTLLNNSYFIPMYCSCLLNSVLVVSEEFVLLIFYDIWRCFVFQAKRVTERKISIRTLMTLNDPFKNTVFRAFQKYAIKKTRIKLKTVRIWVRQNFYMQR